MNWFVMALKKYAVFTGRSQRSEYWYFTLFYILIVIGLTVIDGFTGSLSEKSGMGLLSGLFALAVVIPSIAVGARRLHDIDRTAWWLLIGLIPMVGIITLLIFFAQDSTVGSNRFGANPKASA